jgi:hypothetical protein
MKTYWQLILEVTAAVKSRVAKAIPSLVVPREPYPWSTPHSGWWHPTKPPVNFSWGSGNYHITQVVKNPSAFGTTKEEIYKILMPEYGNDEEMVAEVYNNLMLGLRDTNRHIERHVFKKGWVRVKVLGNFNRISVMVEGISPYTNRAAEIVAIHAFATENKGGRMSLTIADTVKTYGTAEDIERYGKGR